MLHAIHNCNAIECTALVYSIERIKKKWKKKPSLPSSFSCAGNGSELPSSRKLTVILQRPTFGASFIAAWRFRAIHCSAWESMLNGVVDYKVVTIAWHCVMRLLEIRFWCCTYEFSPNRCGIITWILFVIFNRQRMGPSSGNSSKFTFTIPH